MTVEAYIDPYRLQLEPSLQEKVYEAICDMVKNTVGDCVDRDDDLKSYRLQLEGVSEPLSRNEPWPGATDIEATISRELHTTSTAAMWSGARQTPHVLTEAVLPQDIDVASKVESWLDVKSQQFNFDESLYDAIYLANEGRYAVQFVGYSTSDALRFWKLEHTQYDEDGSPVGVGQIVQKEIPQTPGLEFRTPNPWDFYVYPPNAATPQLSKGASLGATNCMERMRFTREDLLAGIKSSGFEEDAIYDLLEKGPISLSYADDEDRDGERSGSETNAYLGRDFECFYVVGRMPYITDDSGECLIPENLMHYDFEWMVCPGHSVGFRQSYSPYPEGVRPYSIYNVVIKPNKMLGEGIVSLVSTIHQEITANKRAWINNLNMITMPCMTVTEAWLTRYSKWTLAPGRMLPRMAGDPTGPQPLRWDTSTQQLIPELLGMLDAEANRLAASQGVNSAMSGKVRKAAEVHFAEAMQQTKFDLFLSNIQRGVKEAYRIMMLLLLHKMPEGGEEKVLAAGKEVTITSDDIRRTLRFIPQASTDSISPAQRLVRQETIKKYVVEYWSQKPMWEQLGCLHEMWHMYHRTLILAGERSPERYLGDEPQQMPLQQAPPGGIMPGTPGAMPGQGPPTPVKALAGVGGGPAGGGMLQASPFNPRTNGSGG